MAKDEVTDNIFSGRTSPRLTFVVGILLGVTLMTTVGIFFFTYVLSGGSVGTYEISPLAPSRSILEEPVGEVVLDGDTEIMIIDSNHVFGATSDYKVTLVQYLDYECLFCTKFFPEVQEFSADNSASIRYVIKHYPITRIHPHAKEAALASECAAEQGMLLEYSSSLYDHRTELNAKLYPVLAEELGLALDQFNSCFESQQYLKQVEQDAKEANDLGIKSQPNLIIWYEDGSIELIDGYVNRSYLESILSDHL